MRSLLTCSVLVASLALASLTGCAAPTEPEDSANGASAATQDPRIALGKDAQSLALTQNGKTTAIGAPAKIAAALRSIDGTITALAAAPRCGPPRLTLAILGADGKSAGTVTACEEDTAFLQVGRDWFEVAFAEPALRAAFAGKAAVGDLLLPATNVVVGNTAGAGETQPAATFKKGLDLDAQPATRAASEVPRCAPIMTLRFVDASKKEVGTVAVFCPKNEDDTVAPATLTVKGKLAGWITFDIAKAMGVF